MAKTKATTSSTPAINDKAKKTSKTIPRMSRAQRAAAVEKNIGKSLPLNEFLASIGWR